MKMQQESGGTTFKSGSRVINCIVIQSSSQSTTQLTMSRPAELLAPDRSRLFPGFETYRLRPLDPARDVVAFPLPGSGATQGRVGYGQQQLGFKEVRSRIAWDHLDTNGTRGVYIDTDWNVVGFELSVGGPVVGWC